MPQHGDNPVQDPAKKVSFSTFYSILKWGRMFRSGDDALQALCDGCNSRRLHHFLHYTRGEGEANDPRALEARESWCKSSRRDQFSLSKREVDAGFLMGLISPSTRVQFPPSVKAAVRVQVPLIPPTQFQSGGQSHRSCKSDYVGNQSHLWIHGAFSIYDIAFIISLLPSVTSSPYQFISCVISSMAERQSSKLDTSVRYRDSAPFSNTRRFHHDFLESVV